MRGVIVDDWAVLRHGLRVVLGEHGVRTLVHVATGADGVEALVREHPELVVMGRCPDMSPGELVRRLVRARADVRILVLVAPADRIDPVTLLSAGAAALVPRTVTGDELSEALERLRRGERYIAPSVLAAMFPVVAADVQDEGVNGLTARERAVLAQLVAGRSNREIADALFIGQETVKTHLRNIYNKLEVAGRQQAVGRAMELGLIA
jgi:two-component system, NarL family, response regulator DevR